MYTQKIKNDRLKKSNSSIDTSGKSSIEDCIESDRGRILNCSAIRRLQQRTQVFPLEGDAAIRSRLTHSLEAQQIGRYLAKEILKQAPSHNISLFEIDDQQELQDYRDAFISLVEMACLLHDIGNPPFGHFGEKAIQDWVKETLEVLFDKERQDLLQNEERNYEQISKDLREFDGNAQGIRIVISLQQLNLTYSQIASFLKYTRGAFEEQKKKKIDKKPGFYLSESKTIEKIRKTLKISKGNRFPLTYIMEAADDISYGIADLEDALNKGVVRVEDLISYVKGKGLGKENVEELRKMWKKACNQDHNSKIARFMISLRVLLIRKNVPELARNYLKHHQEIFDGSFDGEILNLDDKKIPTFFCLKT